MGFSSLLLVRPVLVSKSCSLTYCLGLCLIPEHVLAARGGGTDPEPPDPADLQSQLSPLDRNCSEVIACWVGPVVTQRLLCQSPYPVLALAVGS